MSVFFTRSEDGAVVLAEVARTVPSGDPAAVLRAALTELLEGPTPEERAQGLVSQIPPGTRLLAVRIEDGVARVDLSREVEAGGGSSSMLGRLWQIVYTATQLPQAARVQILIEGQRRVAMGGEGVLIADPLTRPRTPPRF
ncbi:MAG TPA: GerMN domain-containing protein [bacterium]|nr:GerMN domain-containing protein [bacterium]